MRNGERNVLVVDDDPSIRLMIAAVLKRAGMRVDTAGSGREALSRLEQHSYAAVVVDLAMPEIGGAEIVDRIAASGRKRKCVVLISAASESALDKIPERVIHTKLRKPFDIDAIVFAVRECIEGSINDTQPAKRNYPDSSKGN